MNIKKLNTILVAKELKSLYCIANGIIEYEDDSIIYIGFSNYLILLTLEMTDYIDKIYNLKIPYELKCKLKSCRARIKEYNSDAKKLLSDIEKLNNESLEYYSKNLSVLQKIFFNKLITNLGIYKYNNEIISNTFLFDKDLKPIIYKNRERSKEQIMKSGEVIGTLLNTLRELLYHQELPSIKISFDYLFVAEDYNVTKKNKLLSSNCDTSIALFLLNTLSIINYCVEIIDTFNICDELKYRIFYITFYRTYHNMNTIVNDKHEYPQIKKILNKYKTLDNRTFRNSMFHYDITDKLKPNEVNIDEMYYGIISKYLKMNDTTFKNNLKNYLVDASDEISKIILNK